MDYIETQTTLKIIIIIGLIAKLMIHGFLIVCVASILDEINCKINEANLKLLDYTASNRYQTNCQHVNIKNNTTNKL